MVSADARTSVVRKRSGWTAGTNREVWYPAFEMELPSSA
jgi:hypothetical protein